MTHPTRTLAAVDATPSTVRIERELADLRDEITRRPPALVSLDALDRLATAVEGVAQALAPKPTAPEPLGYAVASRRGDDEWMLNDNQRVLERSDADYDVRHYRARYPDVQWAVVALVPVVTP